jgi:hypothetical protein
MDTNTVFTQADQQQPVQQQQAQQQSLDLNEPIANENDALNMLVSFVNIAQRRGVYNVQESAKIWECIQMFMKK